MVTIYPYEEPLIKPKQVYGTLLTHKRGVYLKNNKEQWAELPYIEGVSPYTSAQFDTAIHQIRNGIKPDPSSMEDWMCRWVNEQWKLDGFATPQTAKLIQEASYDQTVLNNIADAYQSGERLFKVKLGRYGYEVEARWLLDRCHSYPDTLWRLDANQRLSIRDARLFCEEIASVAHQIQFFEEPTYELFSTTWASKLPVVLAWDETFRQIPYVDRVPDEVKVIVLKPYVMHKDISMYALIAHLQRCGKDVIISSCYEASVGKIKLRQWAALAKTIPGVDT